MDKSDESDMFDWEAYIDSYESTLEAAKKAVAAHESVLGEYGAELDYQNSLDPENRASADLEKLAKRVHEVDTHVISLTNLLDEYTTHLLTMDLEASAAAYDRLCKGDARYDVELEAKIKDRIISQKLPNVFKEFAEGNQVLAVKQFELASSAEDAFPKIKPVLPDSYDEDLNAEFDDDSKVSAAADDPGLSGMYE